MKKTVFILAIAFVAFISNVNAKEITTFTPNSTIEVIEKSGVNSFLIAVTKGDLDTVKKLIEFGENVNQKTTSGMTPAMYAARYNRVEILEVLIKNGADLNAKCKLGHKALHYAKAAKAKEAMKIIKNSLNS